MLKPQINKEEVARYLGYKNSTIAPETVQDISKCEKMLEECAIPQTHYIVSEINKEGGVSLKNSTLKLQGKSAESLLKDCDKCILLIATIGSGVDELVRKLQITSMLEAVIVDFCASSLVENLMDKFEEQLGREILKEGEFFTDRFSPGYGDMPLAVQKDFCGVLDAQRRVGVCVNSGGMMIPKKTITAVIGIANVPQRKKIKGCEFCDFKDRCEYRKGGKKCD